MIELTDRIRAAGKALSDRKGLIDGAVKTFAVFMALYHLYNIITGMIDPLLYRYTHLAMALFLGYMLLSRKREGAGRIFYRILGGAVIPLYVYLWLNFERIAAHVPTMDMPTAGDMIAGVVLIALILEGTRKYVSWMLSAVSMLFLLYALGGHLLPGIFYHHGLSFAFVIDYLVFTINGIFGSAIGVSSHYIILFIIFGSFVRAVGVGEYFTELAAVLAGRARGGPAKVAVISSALIGSIIGGGTSNVTITGVFTIPVMKKYGFRTNFSAAVEAAASTGGSILPPVMGSAAFLMAEIVGVPYLQVVKASLLPALMYYLAILIMVHIEAVKNNLGQLPRNDGPALTDVLKRSYKLLPIAVITLALVRGYSPSFAGLAGIITCIILGIFNGKNRLTLARSLDSLAWASETVIQIILACAASGIIIGAVMLTGLGGKFAGIILAAAGGTEILVLFFIMLSTIVLGMGMAITPTYIMAALLGAPALIALGFSPVASHLFVLYFAVLAPLTPPVAITAFVAAGIARGNMNRTAAHAFLLASIGFIIPYFFMYHDELLLNGTAPAILVSTATAVVGITCFACAARGYLLRRLNIYERIFAAAGAGFIISPGFTSDLAGLAVLSVLFFLSRKKSLKERQNSIGVTNNTVEERI